MTCVNRKAASSLFRWLGATVALLFLASHSGGPRLAAQCGPNPIVCENAQTGAPASEWDVNGAGDTTLQGFATDISANKGDTVHFKVTTTAVRFNVDIYRLGYYNGMGARKIASLVNITGQNQAACLINSTSHLVDCGNWIESAAWPVPVTAVSGVYIARLSRTDTGGASHIPFVVRDDASTSDLLMQTSDTTWQAYNQYGGFSLYQGSPVAAVKVSYNRPFATRSQSSGLGASNYVFYGEYPMIRWLEANGYNVSYSSGIDTDRRGALIKNHKAFLSVGHDEYWSGQQRTNVEAAREAGVHLAFVSGNEVYWKTRWEASIDGSATAYRTLVTYKETHANQRTDPMDPPIWTGTWRDPRFSPPGDGRPENSLTGQMSMVNRGSAAITVPSAFSKLRFWRNTAVAQLAAGQSTTLGTQTLGYEWDEDVDNGLRPAGQMPLSLTNVSVPERLVDFGTTVAPATTSHSLTLYRHSGGALVFGAGTVQWTWGLDTNHDVGPDNGPAAPDVNMQQATINLLGDMGAQPGTLQAGRFPATPSTDVAAPASTIQSPANGASFAAGLPLTITGTAVDSGGGAVSAVEVSIDGGATWHRATGREVWSWTWRPGVLGAANLMSRAVDDSGNLEALKSPTAVTITPASCPCTLWDDATIPWQKDVKDLNAVELGVKFRTDVNGLVSGIRFYKATTNTGAHVGNLWTASGTRLATANFTGETSSGWQQVTFPTPVSINANTTYVASYHTNVGHYSDDIFDFGRSGVDQWPIHALANGVDGGNGVYMYGASAFPSQSYQATNYWVDVVFNTSDTTPPTVVNVSPLNGGAGVSTNAVATVTFSEAMNAATVTSGTVVLRNSANTIVSSTVSYDPNTRVATLTPTLPLAAATTFNATITGGSAGVKDLAGNALASNFVWSFTTASGTTCPCTIWNPSATPAQIATNDSSAVELGVRFRADASGAISGIRFYKGAGNTGTHVGNLWTNGGALLATATFSGESASGWQQVTFPAPVNIAGNTTYVASYHTNSGNYALNANAFATAGVDNAPLHALASGVDGANGVYLYGGSAFPTDSFNATNYWVDVVYNTGAPDTAPPTVLNVVPVNGATGVSLTAAPAATFSEPMDPTTVTTGTVVLTNPDKDTVPSTVSYNANTNVVTLVPVAPLTKSTTYTLTIIGGVGGVKDLAGNALVTNFVSSFATAAGSTCPCTIWNASATPARIETTDSNSVELGVRFRADTNGIITGIRFYKGATNTGTHLGTLWSNTGALLASAIFTGESGSGWQQVTFPTPVSITANTTYVASYHTNTGNYGVTANAFATAGVDNGPLHALASGVDGASGVYVYGSGGDLPQSWLFPTQTYNATNYWVDVVYSPGPPDTTPPTVLSVTPANGATAVALNASTTAVFSEAMSAATITASTVVLRDPGNSIVASIVSYDANTKVAMLTPTQALAASTTYTATITGGSGGVKDASGNALASSVVWSFTTGTGATCPCTIWNASAAPAQIETSDGSAVELGLRFRADRNGTITGVRFYKAATNTGTHFGSLWTNTGTLLATATFIGETTSGWQQVLFTTPIAVTANTTYVVSYHTNTGNYGFTGGAFTSAGVDNAPLHALASGVNGSNGVYRYGNGFPTDTYNATNYWVDVVFQ